MGKIIVITGTPGAGKTTVLDGALKKTKSDVLRINYGDFMFGIAKERGIKSRDDMRKLPLNEQREIQTAAANQIAAKAQGITIVDTHSTISTPHGYIPGMPEWIIKELKPAAIVLVEASPKEIMRRRSKDRSRARDAEGIESIVLQQQLNMMFASAYSAMTGASVKVIINSDKKLGKAVEELSRLINTL